MNGTDKEITISDLIDVCVHYWKVIVLFGATAGIVSAIVVSAMPQVFESRAYLRLGGTSRELFESVAMVREIMTTESVRLRLAEKISGSSNTLGPAVEYDDQSGLLIIKARAPQPEMACRAVTVAMQEVLVRHEQLFGRARQDMDTKMKYVRQIISQIPRSNMISEFMIRPTRVVLDPAIPRSPLPKPLAQTVSLSVFLGAFFAFLWSSYLTGKRKAA